MFSLQRLRGLLAAVLVMVSAVAWAGPVNINVAGPDELAAELIGIGPALAARIVRYRQIHGRFDRPEDVMNVPYVGRTRFERNRERIRVD